MKRFYYSLVALLAVVLLASCSSEKDGTACLKLIPDNAALVMRFDLKSVGEAMNYEKDTELKSALKELLNEAKCDKKVKDKLKAIIDNPSETGISADYPLYFYVAPNMSNLIGLVGTTGDKDKLVELQKMLADEADLDAVEEHDDMSCLAIEKAAFIVADDWFYLGMGGDDLEERAKDLKELADADKAPIMEKPDFKAMTEKKGQFQMLISGRGLDAFLGMAATSSRDMKEISKVLKQILPGKLSDISILGDANLAKGVSTGTTEVLTYSKEWKDAISEFDGVMGSINAEVAKYLSGDGMIFLANFDGPKVLALIEKVAAKFDKDLSNDEDFKEVSTILSTLNGNMGFGFTGFDGETPEGEIYLSTKDVQLVDLIAAQDEENELKKTGENEYSKPNFNYQFNEMTYDYEKVQTGFVNFGFKQGFTYFVISKDENAMPFNTPAKALPAANIKGKGLYFYMGNGILDKLPNEGNMSDEMMKDMADLYDFVECYYEGNGKFVIRSEMKDKNASLLKIYVDMLKKYLR